MKVTTPHRSGRTAAITVTAVLYILIFPVHTLRLSDYEHQIYVNTSGGVSNTTCWQGGESLPCSNLELALMGAQSYFNSTAVILEVSTEYSLTANFSSLLPLRNMSDFALTGIAENISIICEDGIGLVFYELQGVVIENVTFLDCGVSLLAISPWLTKRLPLSWINMSAGIHFVLCEDVSVISVELITSHSIGMSMLNLQGKVIVSKSSVISTNNAGNHSHGNAMKYVTGVYVGFAEQSTFPKTESTEYIISNCTFKGNRGTLPLNRQSTSLSFGGGLTINFLNNSRQNSILLDSCIFEDNLSQEGAGLLVMFEAGSKDNMVLIKSTQFISNVALLPVNRLPLTSLQSTGGGMKITFKPSPPANNTVVINNCTFYNNSANLGGGIAVSEATERTDSMSLNFSEGFLPNSVQVNNSTFMENHASYGAAVDLFGGVTYLQELALSIIFSDCTFLQNGIAFNQEFSNSFSVVNADRILVTIAGYTLFKGSQGTPLVVRDSSIVLPVSSTLNFTSNFGLNGGAMAFRGSGHITVHSGSEFIFDSNMAFDKGGAFYSDLFNEHFIPVAQNCFIRYADPSVHPDNWNVTFYFSDNRSGSSRNSIFTPSLIPCMWTSKDSPDFDYAIDQTFCWKGWIYEGSDCSLEIATSPAYLNQNSLQLSVYPGRAEEFTLKSFDELNENITMETFYSPASIQSHTPISTDPEFFSNGKITVYGKPNSSANLSIETVGARRLQVEIDLTILPCPPAFVPKQIGNKSSKEFTCVCGGGFEGHVTCNQELFQGFMDLGGCMTFDNDLQEPLLARCPYYLEYAREGHSVIPLPRNASALDESVCGPLNRRGKLCSQCTEGHGIAPLSYGFECVRCTGSTGGRWLAFLFTKFGPITVLFCIIMFFNISVTSAPANGFIYFSQVITVPREVLYILSAFALYTDRGGVVLGVTLNPYSFWNLDFFRTILPLFCIDHNLRALHILALEYVAAFYPLLLIGLTYVCIRLYDRKVKVIVWVWRPFQMCLQKAKEKWNIQVSTSIIDAIAAFLLLSYTKIIFVSFSLLTSTLLRYNSGILKTQVLWYDGSVDFFHKEHLFYAIPALLILVVFVTVPTLLLLFYPFRFFQRLLRFTRIYSIALNTFVEVFQGCFKDGTKGTSDRRYFAGIYFIFRIVAFSLWAMVISIQALFLSLQFIFILAAVLCAVLQPYKVDFYNKLDTILFGILALINSVLYYIYSNFIRTHTISTPALATFYILFFLPMVYILAYVIYCIINHKEKWRSKLQFLLQKFNVDSDFERTHSSRNGPTDPHNRRQWDFADFSLPDRIINPNDYIAYDETCLDVTVRNRNFNEIDHESCLQQLPIGASSRQSYDSTSSSENQTRQSQTTCVTLEQVPVDVSSEQSCSSPSSSKGHTHTNKTGTAPAAVKREE